jgi:hypothetical protein
MNKIPIIITIFFLSISTTLLSADSYWKKFKVDREENSKLNMEIYVTPKYIIPFGDLSQYYSDGFGNSIGVKMLYGNIQLGVETGLFYFSGRNENNDDNNSNNLESTYMILNPLFASIGYKFRFFDMISLIPTLSMGISNDFVKYTIDETSSGSIISQTTEEKAIDRYNMHGYTAIGFDIDIDLSRNMFLKLGETYGFLLEKGDDKMYVRGILMIHIGLGLKI